MRKRRNIATRDPPPLTELISQVFNRPGAFLAVNSGTKFSLLLRRSCKAATKYNFTAWGNVLKYLFLFFFLLLFFFTPLASRPPMISSETVCPEGGDKEDLFQYLNKCKATERPHRLFSFSFFFFKDRPARRHNKGRTGGTRFTFKSGSLRPQLASGDGDQVTRISCGELGTNLRVDSGRDFTPRPDKRAICLT